MRNVLFLCLVCFLLIATFGFKLFKKKYPTMQDTVEQIATKKGMKELPKRPVPKELKILSAEYGIQDQWLDVTTLLQGMIENNQISVYASNTLAGDPLFGLPKLLKVEYILDGEKHTTQVREGMKLTIPTLLDPYDPLRVIESPDELTLLANACPAEVGFYGINLTTGKTLGYRPEQPACMASIVKLFVLLEIIHQSEQGKLEMDTLVTITYSDKQEVCTIEKAIDKMIGISNNEATEALAKLVSYDRVNALPGELSMIQVSNKILPEPGVLDRVLDKRVYGSRVCPSEPLLPQHATAKGMVRFFDLLHQGKLIDKNISEKVLKNLERNPKYFASQATPEYYQSVGKGGSLLWIRPFRSQYNMVGWNLYIYDENEAIAFCLWFERFPGSLEDREQEKWRDAISNCIVHLLLKTDK